MTRYTSGALFAACLIVLVALYEWTVGGVLWAAQPKTGCASAGDVGRIYRDTNTGRSYGCWPVRGKTGYKWELLKDLEYRIDIRNAPVPIVFDVPAGRTPVLVVHADNVRIEVKGRRVEVGPVK